MKHRNMDTAMPQEDDSTAGPQESAIKTVVLPDGQYAAHPSGWIWTLQDVEGVPHWIRDEDGMGITAGTVAFAGIDAADQATPVRPTVKRPVPGPGPPGAYHGPPTTRNDEEGPPGAMIAKAIVAERRAIDLGAASPTTVAAKHGYEVGAVVEPDRWEGGGLHPIKLVVGEGVVASITRTGETWWVEGHGPWHSPPRYDAKSEAGAIAHVISFGVAHRVEVPPFYEVAEGTGWRAPAFCGVKAMRLAVGSIDVAGSRVPDEHGPCGWTATAWGGEAFDAPDLWHAVGVIVARAASQGIGVPWPVEWPTPRHEVEPPPGTTIDGDGDGDGWEVASSMRPGKAYIADPPDGWEPRHPGSPHFTRTSDGAGLWRHVGSSREGDKSGWYCTPANCTQQTQVYIYPAEAIAELDGPDVKAMSPEASEWRKWAVKRGADGPGHHDLCRMSGHATADCPQCGALRWHDRCTESAGLLDAPPADARHDEMRAHVIGLCPNGKDYSDDADGDAAMLHDLLKHMQGPAHEVIAQVQKRMMAERYKWMDWEEFARRLLFGDDPDRIGSGMDGAGLRAALRERCPSAELAESSPATGWQKGEPEDSDGAYVVRCGAGIGVAFWVGVAKPWRVVWDDSGDDGDEDGSADSEWTPGQWPDGAEHWSASDCARRQTGRTSFATEAAIRQSERRAASLRDACARIHAWREGVLDVCGFDTTDIDDTAAGDRVLLACLVERIETGQQKALHFERAAKTAETAAVEMSEENRARIAASDRLDAKRAALEEANRTLQARIDRLVDQGAKWRQEDKLEILEWRERALDAEDGLESTAVKHYRAKFEAEFEDGLKLKREVRRLTEERDMIAGHLDPETNPDRWTLGQFKAATGMTPGAWLGSWNKRQLPDIHINRELATAAWALVAAPFYVAMFPDESPEPTLIRAFATRERAEGWCEGYAAWCPGRYAAVHRGAGWGVGSRDWAMAEAMVERRRTGGVA